MAIRFNLKLFFWNALLYALTSAGAIVAAYRWGVVRLGSSAPERITVSWQSGIVFLLAFVVLSFVLARGRAFAHIILRIAVAGTVFYGSSVVLGVFLSGMWPTAVALLLTVMFFVRPLVITHDLAMLFGIAGISAVLGLSLTPPTAMIVLAALALYDIIAVYRTGHMVRMARTMIQSGAVFGFIVPLHANGFFTSRAKALPGEASPGWNDFMILGSGDVSLPLIFITSMTTVSLASAVITAVFALMGLFAMHLIFVNQNGRHPMAALPPIATVAILGYLVSLGF